MGQHWIDTAKLGLFAVANFLVVDPTTFEILFYLMCMDTLAGAIKSVVLNKGFSFKILLWGLLTKIGVLLIPVCLALLAKGLSFDFRWFVLLVMNLLLIAETFSILTNALSIRQKKQIENVDFITLLLNAIRNGLKNMVKRIITKIEEAE